MDGPSWWGGQWPTSVQQRPSGTKAEIRRPSQRVSGWIVFESSDWVCRKFRRLFETLVAAPATAMLLGGGAGLELVGTHQPVSTPLAVSESPSAFCFVERVLARFVHFLPTPTALSLPLHWNWSQLFLPKTKRGRSETVDGNRLGNNHPMFNA